jgi:outer membrane protein OmpA-like peptidoglycan-associated protein
MNTAYSKFVCAAGMMGMGAAALADTTTAAPPSPQEPAGFISGGVIGAFAAGPVGAVIGAGIGTWLGSKVHRAKQAAAAEAQVALLEREKVDLEETNRALDARLGELSEKVETALRAQAAPAPQIEVDEPEDSNTAKLLDGLEGEVLFRTGSADIPPEVAHGIDTLAATVAKSPGLKVQIDGFADPRGTAESNLQLSQARAEAVRDLFLAAGVESEALEVNAYGKSQSVAVDEDGYALERRVRLKLEIAGNVPLAQARDGASPTGTVGPGSNSE